MLTTNVKRRDIMLVFDVVDGIPNGDPDNGGAPREDMDGRGRTTDTWLKRLIRDTTALFMGGVPGYEMYVEHGAVLNRKTRESYEQAGVVIADDKAKKTAKKGKKTKANDEAAESAEDEGEVEVEVEEKKLRVGREDAEKGNRRIAERYFDARWFGFVPTGVGNGRVTGPLQFQHGRTVDTLHTMSIAGTRCATTNEKQSEAQKGANQNWVRREIISYALYTQCGHLNPFHAVGTGFTEDDFKVFLSAVKHSFENKRSSTKGLMTLQQVIIFEHRDPLGSARASDLFKLVRIERVNEDGPPRSFEDYRITIDRSKLPVDDKGQPTVEVILLYPEQTPVSAAAE